MITWRQSGTGVARPSLVNMLLLRRPTPHRGNASRQKLCLTASSVKVGGWRVRGLESRRSFRGCHALSAGATASAGPTQASGEETVPAPIARQRSQAAVGDPRVDCGRRFEGELRMSAEKGKDLLFP